MTTSFGSICYGSLVIAAVQFLRSGVRMFGAMVREHRGNALVQCMADCIGCCLRWIEDVIDYVNHYAFARIAIYGMDYCNAARQTLTLFTSRGIDMVINDDLTSSVLLLSALLSAVVTALAVAVISKYSLNDQSADIVVLWSFTAFAVSFAMSMSLMVAIKAAIATLFVSFAEGLLYCIFGVSDCSMTV